MVVSEEMNMRVFRNKNFTKRNYECTNIVACQIIDEGAKVAEDFELADESILFGLTPLWIERGIQYWGRL